jgi:hypothetical protein
MIGNISGYLQEPSSGASWVELTYHSLYAVGRVQPRLGFNFHAQVPRHAATITTQIITSEIRLLLGAEVLGHGTKLETGDKLTVDSGRGIACEVFTSREAIHFIEEQFREHTLALTLSIWALLHVRDDGDAPPYNNHYQLHEWFITPTKTLQLSIPIARSDWVKSILEPLGMGSYVLMEMPVPSIPNRGDWEKALALLEKAEEQHALGNDPGVFSHCRGVFEAIQGAPKHIFDKIPDEHKRTAVDNLLKQAVDYFQHGRHVSKTGPQQGEFAVDHRDAEFALGLAKMFLAYCAKILEEPAP